MNSKRAKKYNMRRHFFNKGKGEQCSKCGSLKVRVTSLSGENHGSQCPIC